MSGRALPDTVRDRAGVFRRSGNGLPAGNVWGSRMQRAPREQDRRERGSRTEAFKTGGHALKLGGMTVRNSLQRWGSFAQLLHWVIVALIALQVTLALIADDLPLGMKKLAMLARHKSVGITILGLAAIRLIWRWTNPTPALPETLKPYERVLAHVTHAALYLLLFAMPLSGWLMSSARGFPVSWFGLVQLPDLVPKSKPLYEALLQTHDLLALALGAVVLLHVAAALKHHYVLKDDVLRRMLPFTRTR